MKNAPPKARAKPEKHRIPPGGIIMEYISPEEDALFVKALRFLYDRDLELHGFQASITVTKKEPEEKSA